MRWYCWIIFCCMFILSTWAFPADEDQNAVMDNPLTDDVQEMPELVPDDDDDLDLGDPLEITDRHHRKPPKKEEEKEDSSSSSSDEDDEDEDEKKESKEEKDAGSDEKKGKDKKKSHVKKCVCYLKTEKKHHKRPKPHYGSEKYRQRPSSGYHNQQQKPSKPHQNQHGSSTKKPNTI